MKSYESMLNELKQLEWRGPELAPGVAGHLHKPGICFQVFSNNNGETKRRTVCCLAGCKLETEGIVTPIDQPAPWLYQGLEAFKNHLQEEKEQADFMEVFGRVIEQERLADVERLARMKGEIA